MYPLLHPDPPLRIHRDTPSRPPSGKELDDYTRYSAWFLVRSYKVRCWYWELVELLRRLLLMVILTFVEPKTTAQVAVTLLVCFVGLLVVVLLRPYGLRYSQAAANASYCILVVWLVVGLVVAVRYAIDLLRILAPLIIHDGVTD